MNNGLGKSLLGVFAASSLVAPAFAGGGSYFEESEKGFYVTFGSGVTSIADTDWTFTGGGTKYTGDIEYSPGFSAETGLGYDFGNNVRGELTYVRTTGELDERSIDQGEFINGIGTYHADSVMVSGYWDLGNRGGITPYLGAGIGITQISTKSGEVAKNTIDSGEESVFGFQAKLGASFALTDTNDLFIEGTYEGAKDVEISGVDYDYLGGFGAKAGVRFRF